MVPVVPYDNLEKRYQKPRHVLEVSKAEAVERADAILHKVGMFERRDYYPSHTSSGQQQPAAITRVLAMEPDVMLFDEPTSSLIPAIHQNAGPPENRLSIPSPACRNGEL